jgi:hypothetical protein
MVLNGSTERIYENMKKTSILFVVLFVFFFAGCKKDKLPAVPGTISGAKNLCPGETGINYSISPVDGATYYLWTVPNGTKIISGQGTTSITIEFGKHTGYITVRACNEKETSASSMLMVEQGGISDTWCRELDFEGLGRTNGFGFAIGNKGYIGTGVDVHAVKHKDMWEFDPDLNSWTQKAELPAVARFDAVGFAIGNKGYVGTGYDAANLLSDFWEYDPATNSWTRKADFMGGRRQFAYGFSIGNKGYLGSGRDSSFHFAMDFYEYDPLTDQWTAKSAVIARQGAVGFSIGNKGYLGLGATEIGTPQIDFWQYDPQTDQWSSKHDFIGDARFAASAFSINTKGYIVGGFNSSVNYNDLYEYDPQTDNWTPKTNFPDSARAYGVAFSIQNKGYFGLGSMGSNGQVDFQDFWVYGQ